MPVPQFESPEELPAVHPRAAEPIVALLDRVPSPPGTPLPLLRMEDLAGRFEPPTLSLLDRVTHIAGDPPPEAVDDRIELPVAGLEASAWLSPPVAEAWERCAVAMRADLGRSALVSSGYRSPVFQAMLIVWLAADGGGDLGTGLRNAHPPSRSEHCLPVDHAIDLTTPGAPARHPEHFDGTPEYEWMRERGGEFGFVESYPMDTTDPVGPEPWHWRALVD
jgi:D-alanyl-D-alanine carboxypeptidase